MLAAFPGAMFAMVMTYGLGESSTLPIVYTVIFLFNLVFYVTLFVFVAIVYDWINRKISSSGKEADHCDDWR